LCPDFAYRQTICKHSLALALYDINHPEEPQARKPAPRLAKVKSEDELRRDTAQWRRYAEDLYGA
jgi:hypothetical protein